MARLRVSVMLRVGSLFAGIGGFDLGLERAGMRVVWQCERDEFCRAVLAEHWPGVPCYPDVADLRAGDVEPVDLLCGGFPCQDISTAGKGAGLDGQRSGLWWEFARLIGELRPRYVVAENVPALTRRGLDRILADLAARGFDAEWDHLPASAFGAPHRRDRIWLVAYPDADSRGREVDGERDRPEPGRAGPRDRPALGHDADRLHAVVPDAAGERHEPLTGRLRADEGADGRDADDLVAGGAGEGGLPRGQAAAGRAAGGSAAAPLAHAEVVGLGAGLRAREPAALGGRRPRDGGGPRILADAGEPRLEGPGPAISATDRAGARDPWSVEPDVGRVAHGVPARVDRLHALGNALVPQVAEWIGRRIIEFEEAA